MKQPWWAKYHKLLLLAATFVVAYELFMLLNTEALYPYIISWGYAGTFIAGILFAYGFTAAPATALFLILGQQQTWWLAAVIGAIGAVIGNALIFHVVRYSVADELRKLEKTKSIRRVEKAVPRKLKHFIIPVLAGFIIASPFPDELAVSLLAFTHHISTRELVVVAFILHCIGIASIIGVGRFFG